MSSAPARRPAGPLTSCLCLRRPRVPAARPGSAPSRKRARKTLAPQTRRHKPRFVPGEPPQAEREGVSVSQTAATRFRLRLFGRRGRWLPCPGCRVLATIVVGVLPARMVPLETGWRWPQTSAARSSCYVVRYVWTWVIEGFATGRRQVGLGTCKYPGNSPVADVSLSPDLHSQVPVRASPLAEPRAEGVSSLTVAPMLSSLPVSLSLPMLRKLLQLPRTASITASSTFA